MWTSPYHAIQSIALTICLVAVSIALYGSLKSLWAEFREVDRQTAAEAAGMEKPTAAGEHGQSAS